MPKKKMTKQELVQKLIAISQREDRDYEVHHGDADDLLIEYINSKEVKEAFDNINKWYA